MADEIQKDSIIETEIIDYAFEGKGVAKIPFDNKKDKKFVLFVAGAYPGDKVKVKVIRKKKTFGDGKVLEIIEPSPFRTEAECGYFGICGGCRQQELSYERQLFYKRKQTEDIFERVGGLRDFAVEEIIPAEEIYHYRNKMEFSFSDKRWLLPEEISDSGEIQDRNFALGLHIPRIYDKVLDIEDCRIQKEVNNGILNFTREFFKSRNETVYTTKTHSGYLRNLVIKNSSYTGDIMANIVTRSENDELMKEYSAGLSDAVPEITTIVNNISSKKAMVSYGDYEKIYLGTGYIYDFLGGLKFRISSNSFFQTNTKQAEKLYAAAAEYAEFKGDEIVYDLYSGAGTITSFISKDIKRGIGFEDVQSAVDDAVRNKSLNQINNIEFYKTNLNRSMMPIVKENNLPKPDIIIADPPRGGMNPRTINDIEKLSPEKIVYVSCNPSTQARDIKLLTFKGYKLVKMRPVDMFPHTFHIENVALLIKE